MVLDYIYIDIALFFICLVLCYGFYTGNSDWLMVYYGCAPNKLKDKVDRQKILSVTSISFAIMAVLEFITCFIYIIIGYDYYLITRALAGVVFVFMVVYTGRMCYIAYHKK